MIITTVSTLPSWPRGVVRVEAKGAVVTLIAEDTEQESTIYTTFTLTPELARSLDAILRQYSIGLEYEDRVAAGEDI